jgi:hypothetical protein
LIPERDLELVLELALAVALADVAPMKGSP